MAPGIERLFACPAVVARLHPADKRALECVEAGDTKASFEPAASGGPPRYHLAERMQAGEELLRQLDLSPQSSRRSGVVVLRSAAARRAVLVFNGIAERFTLSRLLAAQEHTHVILVKDPNRCFGLLGIPGLGEDYTACIHNLRRILSALNADDVYCIGISAGGAMAIKSGCDLNVRGILGFSIPTTLDLRDDAGADMSRYPQLVRLYRRARHLGTDLTAYYTSHARRPAMMLVFSRGHARDAWLAERMLGVPGVALLETEGYGGHDTHHWCVNHGIGHSLLDRLFALQPLSA